MACGQSVDRRDKYCVYCQHRLSTVSQWAGALVVAGLGVCSGAVMLLLSFNYVVPLVVVMGGFVLALWVFSFRR
ncbi:MAG: hypothetical protein JW753_00805 [Dehalococcoidia bacterium]|nr:hypothetical protein [Dehalococcoidia bacterium]